MGDNRYSDHLLLDCYILIDDLWSEKMERRQLMQDLVRESYIISDDVERLVADLMLVLKKKDLENKILQEKLLFYETSEAGDTSCEREKRLFDRLKQNLCILDQKLGESVCKTRPKSTPTRRSSSASSARAASLSPMPGYSDPAARPPKPPHRSLSVPNQRLKSCLKPSPGWK